jgi:hypothetical protein
VAAARHRDDVSDTAAFALPAGAVLVKAFRYPVDRRDPALGIRRLETRLLVRTDDAWPVPRTSTRRR